MYTQCLEKQLNENCATILCGSDFKLILNGSVGNNVLCIISFFLSYLLSSTFLLLYSALSRSRGIN